jgi:hypothetical protein
MGIAYGILDQGGPNSNKRSRNMPIGARLYRIDLRNQVYNRTSPTRSNSPFLQCGFEPYRLEFDDRKGLMSRIALHD